MTARAILNITATPQHP